MLPQTVLTSCCCLSCVLNHGLCQPSVAKSSCLAFTGFMGASTSNTRPVMVLAQSVLAFWDSLLPQGCKSKTLGPLAVVGVVRCMGRSLGIAGELTSCALFVFPQVSPRLVALHLHVYIYIFILQVLYLPSSLQQLDSLAWSAAIQVPARPPSWCRVLWPIRAMKRAGVLSVGPGAL